MDGTGWKIGDHAKVRAVQGYGYWSVRILDLRDNGRFAKVKSSGGRGQLGKPRWVETTKLWREE